MPASTPDRDIAAEIESLKERISEHERLREFGSAGRLKSELGALLREAARAATARPGDTEALEDIKRRTAAAEAAGDFATARDLKIEWTAKLRDRR